MDIHILHIDDEPDVLQKVAQVIDGYSIGDYTLCVRGSCGFTEGMQKLSDNQYDLVILDLCIGNASSASDKVGETIFRQIKERAFIPVVFFTGLPAYVQELGSDVVKIAGKGDGYDSLFHEIEDLIATDFIQLKSEVNLIVKEGLRSYFWDFVHPNAEVIKLLRKDDVSLKYILLRRLGKNISTKLARIVAEDPEFNDTHKHPMEFYIYPVIDGEYETGDIIKSKADHEHYVVLTPSCDLVSRGGKRNAEVVMLVHARNFKTLPEYVTMKELQRKLEEVKEGGEGLTKEEQGQLKNSPDKLKKYIAPGGKDRYFFLPQTPFIPALVIDFQKKKSVSYEELVAQHDRVATLDDPISQVVQASYTRYFSRVGYQDLDIEYAFAQIIKE